MHDGVPTPRLPTIKIRELSILHLLLMLHVTHTASHTQNECEKRQKNDSSCTKEGFHEMQTKDKAGRIVT
jgi:hypothetical protein